MKLKVSHHWTGTPAFTGAIPVVEGWIAFDTETTGLDPWGTRGLDRLLAPSRPFMATVTNADGECALIRWQVDALTRDVRLCGTEGEAWLRGMLADESVAKTGYNVNFDVMMMRLMGFEVRGEIFDVMHAVHALSPGEFTLQLKPVCKKFLGITDEDEKTVLASAGRFRASVRAARKKNSSSLLAKTAIFEPYSDEEYDDESKKKTDKNASKADMWLADETLCNAYGTQDALRTATLREWATSQLDLDAEKGGKLWEIFRQEQELQTVIDKMQTRGVRVEEAKVEELGKFYHDLRVEHEANAKSQCGGRTVDFNSAQALQIELLVDQALPIHEFCINKITKQPTKCVHCKGKGCAVCGETGKNPKVDADFLVLHGVDRVSDEDLRPMHLLCWHLLHARAANSMLGFIKSYRRFGAREADGLIVHPNYKQVGTKTGRLSAENPNLQNVADDESGKKKCTVAYRPRECFIPREGHIFYIPDYSQIEIWMLALRAQAPALLKILMEGGDTHGRIASLVWKGQFDLDAALKAKKQRPDDLKKDELDNLKIYVNRRKRSKNLQFCKVYGGGPPKIAKMIGGGCTVDEAKRFILDYDRTLPEVPRFMSRRIREAKENGRITNAFGRVYQIDPNFAYKATNYDLQGSAADLIKRAMVRVDKALQPADGHLLLTIHDELLMEVPIPMHSDKLMRGVAWAMQSDHKLLGCPVPFPVGFKIAEERWSKAKEVKL